MRMLTISLFHISSLSPSILATRFSISSKTTSEGIGILVSFSIVGPTSLVAFLFQGTTLSINCPNISGNLSNAKVSPIGAQSTINTSYFPSSYISFILNRDINSSKPGNTNNSSASRLSSLLEVIILYIKSFKFPHASSHSVTASTSMASRFSVIFNGLGPNFVSKESERL